MRSVQTVTGSVSSQELGVILPHEHLRARLWDRPAVAAVAYGGMFGEVLVTADQIASEVDAYKAAGGRTIVDVTLPAIGRDPRLLRSIAERCGVQIVMGCGWYREPYYQPEELIDRRSVDHLADELVAEIEHGVGETGIRPGIIGEIGVNNTWVSAQEERVHRAAARAGQRTGLAVTTHSSWSPVGLQQMDILTSEGLGADRIIIGHACSVPDMDYYLEVLGRGAFLEFDNIGQWDIPGYQERVTSLILKLLELGYEDQLLLSHDAWGVRSFKFAGGPGFTHIVENYLPILRKNGISESQIESMTVSAPARALAGPE
jgi:predicted metal-dependent phosphotriesterase family hydrolase